MALFEEFAIGSLTARNRIVRAATTESLASESGRPTSRISALYAEIAEGGAGCIVTGYAYVTPDGKPSENALSLCHDGYADDYRALTHLVHERGARIVAQLAYGGSKSKLAPDDPRRRSRTDSSPDSQAADVDIVGPSALEHPRTHLTPREATPDDLDRIARAFGQAAARAQAYGFDGVEVHAAHGYLLSQFLDRRLNARADGYGGTLEHRARFAADCVAQARRATGDDYPLFVKVNSCDDMTDPEGTRGGLGEDESAQAARLFVEAGASAIEVSGDWHAVAPRDVTGRPFFAEFGARLAAETHVPVIVTGGWRNPGTIEKHLAADGIAAIGMSRPLICEPALPNRWHSGNRAPSACTACGYCQKHPGIPCALREA